MKNGTSFIESLAFHSIVKKMICLKGKGLTALAILQFLAIMIKIMKLFPKSWFVSMVIIKKNKNKKHLNPSMLRLETEQAHHGQNPKKTG